MAAGADTLGACLVEARPRHRPRPRRPVSKLPRCANAMWGIRMSSAEMSRRCAVMSRQLPRVPTRGSRLSTRSKNRE
eukprot:scaffold31783_cov129-Isochrysis_galbana.AAC.3